MHFSLDRVHRISASSMMAWGSQCKEKTVCKTSQGDMHLRKPKVSGLFGSQCLTFLFSLRKISWRYKWDHMNLVIKKHASKSYSIYIYKEKNKKGPRVSPEIWISISEMLFIIKIINNIYHISPYHTYVYHISHIYTISYIYYTYIISGRLYAKTITTAVSGKMD